MLSKHWHCLPAEKWAFQATGCWLEEVTELLSGQITSEEIQIDLQPQKLTQCKFVCSPHLQPTPCLSADLLSLRKNLLKKGVSNLIGDLVTHCVRSGALLSDAQALCGLSKHQAVPGEGLRLCVPLPPPVCPQTPAQRLAPAALLHLQRLAEEEAAQTDQIPIPLHSPSESLWTSQHSLGRLLRPENAVKIQRARLFLYRRNWVWDIPRLKLIRSQISLHCMQSQAVSIDII